MEDILHGLNAAQRTAVASEASVLQVLAPPGSGKTKTLTARVAYHIAHQQLQPWNIIVCTFTVKAANEMKQRIKNFVGEDLSKQLKLGTFHSVALRYLKVYGQHIGLPKDFGIADSSDSKAILKRLIKKLGMTLEPGSALGRISARKVKGDSLPPDKGTKNAEQHEFNRLYDEYESTLAASNLLDYDDILLRCCSLLKSHPQCVANVQAVLIDEFQDTNNTQYDLMGLFAQQRNIITIVGDPDQSIYGFRSAEIKNLTRMRTQWPDTLTINLEENYRSSGAILHAAQTIIEQDESRPPKKLQATHSLGLRPVLRKLPSAYAEAEWLVAEITRIQCLSGAMMEASDFAILLRSAALSRTIESALVKKGVPYRMVAGTRFYDRVEVKLVLDYLRVFYQPDNSESVERIINVPSRKVGEKTIKELREEAHFNHISLWALVLDISQGRCTPKTKLTEPNRKGLSSFVDVILSGRKKIESWTEEEPSVVGLISLLSQKILLQSYLRTKFAQEDDFETRWANIEELMAQAEELSRPSVMQELVEAGSLPVLEDIKQRDDSDQDILGVFLANIALTASADKTASEGGEKVQQVTISTIHAAKGLEWPVVFIPACYDGSIPHSRADDDDEERRLLYVGMTRAQALLYLSCPVKNTQRQDTIMSTFLVHQGANKFFEEHGPSLAMNAVTGLAKTLRRECPAESKIAELKKSLEHDEDNKWPLNGEESLEGLAKWDRNISAATRPGFSSSRSFTMTSMQKGFSTGSATMPVQAGFLSVSARYEELMEQSAQRKVDRRIEDQEKKAQQQPEQPQGRKRHIEGQGSVANLFKRPRASPEKEDEPAASAPASAPKRPLGDGTNRANIRAKPGFMTAHSTIASHKPRSGPMFGKPTQAGADHDRENRNYVFLSSSPPPPDPEDEPTAASTVEDREGQLPSADTKPVTPGFRPASTFHTTSVQASAPHRKTLGVRRSLHGWPPPKRS